MARIILLPWVTIIALLLAFACGLITIYRSRRVSGARMRAIIAFTSTTLAGFGFYVVTIAPYSAPPELARLYALAALLLLCVGLGILLFIGLARSRRLTLEQVCLLLPAGIRELRAEELRELLPPRFRRHTLHDTRALVFAMLAEMPPETLRTLSPETLRASLRCFFSRSLLDQR